MKSRCIISGEEFEVGPAELERAQSFGAPAPRISPLERQRRRIVFRNFRKLYRRKCDLTAKPIISMYHEKQPFPVYDYDVWWSDKWDARDFAMPYDSRRSFLEQYAELNQKVPRMAIARVNCENSEYVNMGANSRNCYLVFGCIANEDCLYGHIVWSCVSCLDTLYAYRSQWCSHSTDIVDCYEVHFSTEVTNCRDSYFLHDCIGCSDCFACYNLRKKQYCFFNEQCTKEEYYERLKKIMPLDNERVRYSINWLDSEVKKRAKFPPFFGVSNEEASGNHIYQCRDLINCFDIKTSERSQHCYTTQDVEYSADISFTGGGARFSYNCLTMFNAERALASHWISDSSDIAYSEFCVNSSNLLGCNGLKRAQFCILNKQYSEEEYKALYEQIKKEMLSRNEWGEFFPMNFSPFAYNESVAQEYQPLSREDVIKRGLRWIDEPELVVDKSKLRDISKMSDKEILAHTFTCAVSGKQFRFQRQELEFYRARQLPLPDICPDARWDGRFKKRAPRELIERACVQCGEKVLTCYTENLAESLTCFRCYA